MPKPTNCLAGMVCPCCKQTERFRIEAKSMFTVMDDGTEDYQDVEWDNKSYAECPECLWHGCVGDLYDTLS